jgi:hypothetical protein
MEPSFGWTLLSRDALRRAETQLRDDAQGVRDEVGFLALHQAYADRFFPGTSVLHTRLRYALFVPWLYRRLIDEHERKQVSARIEKLEIELAGRLKKSGERGVIGGDSYPNPTSQPASMVYWTALGTWRILRALPNGNYPMRRSLHRSIAMKSAESRILDDDKQPLDEMLSYFASIPTPPSEWNDASRPLSFRLLRREADFLRGCLLTVSRTGTENVPSLMAQLVEHDTPLTDRTPLWSKKVRTAADDNDRVALTRAQQAAALSAIGRGVYAALVEELRETQDDVITPNTHRDYLSDVIDEFANDALKLEISDIQDDSPHINKSILSVLTETQNWLKAGARDIRDLHPCYQSAEYNRKFRRARLRMTLAGRDKRLEWDADKHTKAEPLHFRWGKVRQLLIDLNGGR